MSNLIHINTKLGKFHLDIKVNLVNGINCFFGPSGAGKTSIINCIAGFILSFARSLGEFGATVTFVSNIPGETQTLSAAIYTFLQIPNGEYFAMRLTIISILISVSALVLSETIFDKFIKYKREKI